jgi:hypothetical protein
LFIVVVVVVMVDEERGARIEPASSDEGIKVGREGIY